MLIALFLDDEGLRRRVSGGLETYGHEVVALSATAALPDGCSPEVVVHEGLRPPASVRSFLDDTDDRAGIALIAHGEMAQWAPGPGKTDFAVEPVSAEEVLARVRLHVARLGKTDDETLRAGGIVIDVANYTVASEGRLVELTYREYELLKFLMTNPGRVFTRESLLSHVWGYDYWGGSRTIDVHIRRIRAKLPAAAAACIETVHQVGYRFSARP